jgi:hypothetical protein
MTAPPAATARACVRDAGLLEVPEEEAGAMPEPPPEPPELHVVGHGPHPPSVPRQ